MPLSFRNAGALAAENPLPFEASCDFRFEEENHRYILDGVELPSSVTSVVGRDFAPFDAEAVIESNYGRWRQRPESRYGAVIAKAEADALALDPSASREDLFSASAAAIKAVWDAAAPLGTLLHKHVELALNGELPEGTAPPAEIEAEFRMWEEGFLRGVAAERGLVPFRTELSLFWRNEKDGKVRIGGQIDALFVDSEGKHWIVDWKRTAKDTRSGGRAQTDGLKFALQASAYALLLWQCTSIWVPPERRRIVQVHPELDAAVVYAPKDVDAVARSMLNEFVENGG